MKLYSTMTRELRREGPPLYRLRRALSWPAGPLAVAGTFVAPIVVLVLPAGLVDHEAEWVRLVGIVGSLLTATVCVLAAWALACDVRADWRRGEVDLDTIAFMCGFALTPLVIGLLCLAAGVGPAR